ncbi:MAG: 3-oxoacyl-ACP synthase [Treponema sp.]|nr:3-oxoacyl-ACP synthase [Treponema sp.]
MKKIYLSEPGLICCAGRNKDELYRSCITGNKSGMIIRKLAEGGNFPTGQIQCREIPPVELPVQSMAYTNACYTTDTRLIRIIDKALEQMRPTIEKAIAVYGHEKIGVCLGSCDNGSEGSLLGHREFFTGGSFPEDYRLYFQSASFPAEYIALKFGLKGPVFTVATACASGASAIMRGAELIRAGFCSAVIAGGADVVSETVLMGFHALEAVSNSPTNPLSKNRKGINLGEGAAFFLLDSDGSHLNGCSHPYGCVELLGAGESADAYHMTAPGPDGAGPAKAMKTAIMEAQITPSQIDYINLHGTGTDLNDKAEAFALRDVFGETIPHVSSTKPIMGHTLGAAGALETAVCWMVLKEQKGLPVHCWDGDWDEEFPSLPVVSLSGIEQHDRISICMTNSFAFGGCNVSLIIGSRT